MKKFDKFLIGFVFAFFAIGIGSICYLYFTRGKDPHPGGFLNNRGKVESIGSNTITLQEGYAWSDIPIRITDETTILDIGKQVIDIGSLKKGDLIFVYGIENDDRIEAVTVNLLPPDSDDE